MHSHHLNVQRALLELTATHLFLFMFLFIFVELLPHLQRRSWSQPCALSPQHAPAVPWLRPLLLHAERGRAAAAGTSAAGGRWHSPLAAEGFQQYPSASHFPEGRHRSPSPSRQHPPAVPPPWSSGCSGRVRGSAPCRKWRRSLGSGSPCSPPASILGSSGSDGRVVKEGWWRRCICGRKGRPGRLLSEREAILGGHNSSRRSCQPSVSGNGF